MVLICQNVLVSVLTGQFLFKYGLIWSRLSYIAGICVSMTPINERDNENHWWQWLIMLIVTFVNAVCLKIVLVYLFVVFLFLVFFCRIGLYAVLKL